MSRTERSDRNCVPHDRVITWLHASLDAQRLPYKINDPAIIAEIVWLMTAALTADEERERQRRSAREAELEARAIRRAAKEAALLGLEGDRCADCENPAAGHRRLGLACREGGKSTRPSFKATGRRA